ncbi:hypothetical protein PAXINDRAFT_101437 [Paxillus involutus ATCC 200175]|uniref:Uncharacterized protein n=1 Tax=Paxillus involutus ATCC 200175 TaxID=664439 RepID=A0A0C9TXD2_PAXIN|nr:hypothetical protein PAXINDRAFT_101437 [Paxillus involutus ATCC 200175]
MTIAVFNAFRKAKTISKHENNIVDVGPRECPLPRGPRSNSKIFKFGKFGVHSKAQPEERAETTSPSPVGAFTNIQAKQQQKISRTVKSLKEDIRKILKRPGGASPTVSTNKPAVECDAVSHGKVPAPDGEEQVIPSLHPSPGLTASVPRNVVHGVCTPLAQVWGSSEATASLVSCGEHPMGVHFDEFVSSCAVAEPPSPLLSSQLLVISHTVEPESDFNVYISPCVSSEHPMIEEKDEDTVSSLAYCASPNSSVQNIQESLDLKQAMPAVAPSIFPAHVDEKVDVEELQATQEMLTARSSPCVPLGESASEAELNAMWEAEFAAFKFDSGNIEEWTDEVEIAKQAKYDAHFAYAEKALAVPVPKLSSFFSRDSLAIKDHFPTTVWGSSEATASLVSCGEHPMGVHFDEFVSSCAVAEPPSPLLSSQLLVISHTVEPESDFNVYISPCVSSEHPMIEEKDEDTVSSLAYCASPNSSVQNIQESLDLKQAMPAVAPSIFPAHVDEKVDVEELQATQEMLTARSSPCVPLGESASEAELNAMWEAEFAAFKFDSGNIEEWTDEVEIAKQAKYDAHFAYAEKALAVPVPKLSSFFSRDSLAIKDHFPTRTQSSESSGSSTLPDTSLATTIDLGDSPPRSFAAKLRGLRRVPKHVDLRNSQVSTTAECVLSPDLPRSPLDLPGSDLVTILEIGAAPLSRTEKRRGMKQPFLSFGGKMRSFGEVGKGKDLRSWVAFSGTLEPSPPSLNAKKTSSNPGSVHSEATWTSNEFQEVSESSISHSHCLLQAVFRPSCGIRTAIFSSRPSPSLSSSTSPVWSCAKITRATNGKRRKQMTKESMKALKKRLDSMDIDPWY